MLGSMRSAMIVAGSFLFALTVATAQPTTTYSRWVSLTPDPRQFATQPGGVLPLAVVGDASFAAGRYMIYVATSNPDGKTISRWSSFGPFNLQGGEKWQAMLLPGAKLRMEKNPAALLTYSSPGSGQAMIYARNEDRSSWQSVCVLPVGGNVRTDCFGGTSNVVFAGAGSATLSKWTSITPDQRQFAAQPGGMLPLAVLGGPNFVAGAYMIYVGPANPDGRAVGKWNAFGPFTLEGDDKWAAHLLPQSQLRMEKNPAGLLPYPSPGAMRAMIYARNDDTSSWQAICVLPVGMTVTPSCFGGSGNIVVDVKGLAAGIDGTYSGSIAVTQTTPEKLKAVGPGTLTLTVTNGTVSGTMIVRTGDVEKRPSSPERSLAMGASQRRQKAPPSI